MRKYDLIIVERRPPRPRVQVHRGPAGGPVRLRAVGPRLRLDPRRRQRRARLAPRLEGDARRRLLPRRPARRQDQEGHLHGQDRRHLEPDHAGTQGLPAQGRALLPPPDACRTSSPWPRSNTRGPPGRSPGPGPTARAASSTPRSATATSGPDKDDPIQNPNLSELVIRASTGSRPAGRGETRQHPPECQSRQIPSSLDRPGEIRIDSVFRRSRCSNCVTLCIRVHLVIRVDLSQRHLDPAISWGVRSIWTASPSTGGRRSARH